MRRSRPKLWWRSPLALAPGQTATCCSSRGRVITGGAERGTWRTGDRRGPEGTIAGAVARDTLTVAARWVGGGFRTGGVTFRLQAPPGQYRHPGQISVAHSLTAALPSLRPARHPRFLADGFPDRSGGFHRLQASRIFSNPHAVGSVRAVRPARRGRPAGPSPAVCRPSLARRIGSSKAATCSTKDSAAVAEAGPSPRVVR